jgi:apolipoprotein D and lipocalin family protein
MKRVTGIGLAAAGACALIVWRLYSRAGPCGNPHVPQPARPVDLARYTGKWFELARYPARFERYCDHVTAEYLLRPDWLLSVINTGHAANGRKGVVRGRAKAVRGSGVAKLKLSFFGPFFSANYWILDHDDDYRWAIVGHPSGRYLWILHREAVPSASERERLRERVAEMGYDLSLLRTTRQDEGAP